MTLRTLCLVLSAGALLPACSDRQVSTSDGGIVDDGQQIPDIARCTPGATTTGTA